MYVCMYVRTYVYVYLGLLGYVELWSSRAKTFLPGPGPKCLPPDAIGLNWSELGFLVSIGLPGLMRIASKSFWLNL